MNRLHRKLSLMLSVCAALLACSGSSASTPDAGSESSRDAAARGQTGRVPAIAFSNDGCFSTQADADAQAAGAVTEALPRCARAVAYTREVTTVVLTGATFIEDGGSIVRRVDVSLNYRPAKVLLGSWDESTPYTSTSGVDVEIGYSARSADFVTTAWRCDNSGGPGQPALGRFNIVVKSFEKGHPAGNGFTTDTVHGTLHAVCAAPKGSVTIDGTF
jgi:hypothetical protein